MSRSTDSDGSDRNHVTASAHETFVSATATDGSTIRMSRSIIIALERRISVEVPSTKLLVRSFDYPVATVATVVGVTKLKGGNGAGGPRRAGRLMG